jgi:type I site-specific restriction-modification system R (restriction) subunit
MCFWWPEKVEAMGLSVAEVAFYDALANNQSAQDLMGDEVLMKMARELAEKLRGNLSIDWHSGTTANDDQGPAQALQIPAR